MQKLDYSISSDSDKERHNTELKIIPEEEDSFEKIQDDDEEEEDYFDNRRRKIQSGSVLIKQMSEPFKI